MSDPMRPLKLAAHALLAAVASVLLSSGAARAQLPQSTQSSQASQEARDAQNARNASIERRHRALDEVGKLKNTPRAAAENTRLPYTEVAEDFKQLQLSNYSLAQAAQPGVQLDYALIKKEAAEIVKRASRLKSNLALPKPEEGRKADTKGKVLTPDELGPAIASLDALVNSFVGNPYFRRPEVADFEQTSKASRELAEIITLSERIRRYTAGSGEAGRRK